MSFRTINNILGVCAYSNTGTKQMCRHAGIPPGSTLFAITRVTIFLHNLNCAPKEDGH